eukprot:CAMPEP_0176427856 /NCGR_PEP_ID=MMETSP0127-20121128/12813_1 /TAXON_ID=938130 /ORGANISM="Platyophrya macrostoma, Strain WH" /LENGTH=135 /DNA_ID=CAMNT_0017809447 /DNA_START=32 /DNA_END=436 /DNA_ORIENTATION=+
MNVYMDISTEGIPLDINSTKESGENLTQSHRKISSKPQNKAEFPEIITKVLQKEDIPEQNSTKTLASEGSNSQKLGFSNNFEENKQQYKHKPNEDPFKTEESAIESQNNGDDSLRDENESAPFDLQGSNILDESE